MADIPAPNYASFNTPAPDPLALASQYQQYQNAKSQNALIQQETQNQTDQNPGIVAQSQRQQIGAVSDQAANSMQLYANRNKLLGDLYEKTDSNGNPNVSQKDMSDAIIQHVADGSMSAMDGVNTMATFPKQDNPQANRAYLKLHIFQNQNNIDQLNTAAGNQQNINVGDQVYQGVQQSAYEGGGFTPATSAAIGMSPESKASRQNMLVQDPKTGQMVPALVPNSSLVDRAGIAPNTLTQQSAPINSGGNALAPDTSNRPAGWNSASDPGQAPNVASNAPQPASSIPGAIQSGYAPGTEATANTMGTLAANNYGADLNALKGSASTIFNMKNALEALQNAKTGTGTGATQAIKSFAVAMDPGLQNTQWGNDVEAYDKANKYLTSQAQLKANSVGPNTNSNLATAAAGSPNVHINNLAAQDVQKVNLALQRMDYLRTATFQDAVPNGTPQDYQNYAGQFNKSVDPRALMVEEMSPSKVTAMLESMPPTLKNGQPNPVRQNFDNTYTMAIKYGLMNHGAATAQPRPQVGGNSGQ